MPDIRASLLLLVATPDRAFLTLLIGTLLVYRELIRPGRVLPGVLGGVMILTALHAMSGYRITAQGAILLASGLALVVVQGFHRWFWIPGLLGTLLLLLGSHLVFIPAHRISWRAAVTVVPFSGITVFLLRTAVRARRNKVSDQAFS